MTSSLLPSHYWLFGVKRAMEVLNLLPTQQVKKKVTPNYLVYNKKGDYRHLFSMFSTAYIKQETNQGGIHKNKFLSKH